MAAENRPFAPGGRQLVAHAPGAGGLAEQRHAARVAPEARDVGLDPAQGRLLVEQREGPLARRAPQARMGQEPEGAEAVVERHHHGIGAAGERARIVLAGGAEHEGAAVDPHHDGLAGAGSGVRGRVDVEGQAIFLAEDGPGAVTADLGGEREVLEAARAERCGGTDLAPGGRRLGRAPAQGPDRRGRIGEAEEGLAGAGGDALDRPEARLDAPRPRVVGPDDLVDPAGIEVAAEQQHGEQQQQEPGAAPAHRGGRPHANQSRTASTPKAPGARTRKAHARADDQLAAWKGRGGMAARPAISGTVARSGPRKRPAKTPSAPHRST